MFTVTVNPCEIFDYSVDISLAAESYIINHPALTTFEYTFTQTNKCGYPEVISVDQQFDFLTHNELERSFTVETGLREFTGVYTATVSSTITVPDDYLL